MTYSKDCIDLIKDFEGLYLKAYLCPAGVPTIGYGSVRWPDGQKVQLGQTVTMDGAEELLRFEDRKSTRLNSSHVSESRMPSSA